MKKIFVGVLSVIMILSFSACGKNKPENALDTMLSALKSGDEKTIDKFIESARGSLESYITTDDITIDEDSTDALTDDDTYKILLKKMEYKIDKATVKDDIASVPVSITIVDMQKLLGNYLTEAYTHVSDETWDEEKWIKDEINKDSAETATIKTHVNMIKSDGKWTINKQADNEGLVNALTGGLFNYAKSMLSAFDDGEE